MTASKNQGRPRAADPLLVVEDLSIGFESDGVVTAITDKVSFEIRAGEIFGMVGESGCGKSVTCLALMKLLPSPGGRILSGRVLFQGRDVLSMENRDIRRIRGSGMSMIFQEPGAALNPLLRVKNQMLECFQYHPYDGDPSRRISELLEKVGIADPDRILMAYPHELSGGMLQRVMIAMALLLKPPFIIADEPTTALDVTVQAQIMEMLVSLQKENGTAILLVTHNLNLIAQYADRLVVMYAGRIVEQGQVEGFVARPLHPYSQGLLGALPDLNSQGREWHAIPGQVPKPGDWLEGCRFRDRCPHAFNRCVQDPAPFSIGTRGLASVSCFLYDPADPAAQFERKTVHDGDCAAPAKTDYGGALVKVKNLRTFFPVTGGLFHKVVGHVKAVNGVDLEVAKGEIVSVVGESGCGKSTLGMSLLGLVTPTSGQVILDGHEVDIRSLASWKSHRKDFQIVFQDPYSSLNPRHTVYEILSEPMVVHGICARKDARDAVADLLLKVGLEPDYMQRFPHAFSGGQRQRLGIARAVGLQPKLIVCDEVVAALDVSVQAQIIDLLLGLKSAMGLSLLFISHDLSLVKSISDRIHVMYLGKIVESADAGDLFLRPRHPYTQALLDSIPTLDRRKPPKLLGGEVPSPVNLPPGCGFAGRCSRVQEECRLKPPELHPVGNSSAACFFPLEG